MDKQVRFIAQNQLAFLGKPALQLSKPDAC